MLLLFITICLNSTRNFLQRFNKSRAASRNRLSRFIVDDPRRSNFCITKIGSVRKVANALREERNYGAGRRISMRRRRNWPGSLNAISWRITMEIRILAAREYTYVRHSRAGHGASTVRRDSNVISFHITREPNLASTILPHGTENGFDLWRDPNSSPLGATRTKFYSWTTTYRFDAIWFLFSRIKHFSSI